MWLDMFVLAVGAEVLRLEVACHLSHSVGICDFRHTVQSGKWSIVHCHTWCKLGS
jgi:hypothetical protein